MRIDGSQSPLSQFSSGSPPPQDMAAQTGTLRGTQVQVEDSATSVLADAAEELVMFAAEKVEHKSLDERKVSADKPIDVMHVEEIMAYLDAAKVTDDPQHLAAIAKRLLSGQENPQELARRESRDPTGQYALLQYALHEGMGNGTSEEILDSLRDALADLEMEHGPQIRSTLNTIGVAAEFGSGAEEIAAFQSTYQDVVLGEATLAQTLALVLDKLSGRDGDDFAHGLHSLIKAMGQDLAAARPSIDATRLQTLVQDLYQLEVTATVVAGCKDLAATLAEKHGCANLQPIALMKELVAVTNEKWVSASRFSGLADKFGIREVGAQIAFHAATRGLLREMPVKVYPDSDVRQSILNAAQEALDHAIDLEEE